MSESEKPSGNASKINWLLTAIAILVLIAGIGFAFYKSKSFDTAKYTYQKQGDYQKSLSPISPGVIANTAQEDFPNDIVAARDIKYTAENQFVSKGAVSEDTVSLIAVGDIMLSRTVAKKIKQHKDVNYPFLKIKEFIKSADIAFGNLECPITAGPEVLSGQMRFHADPGSQYALRDAGFSILSLANNHTSDYGTKGIADTINYLDEVGIKYTGAGQNLDQARQAAYVETKGIKIAFLAYNDPGVVPKSYGATENHAGANFMNIERLASDIQAARQNADLVIVSMHAGVEYSVPDKKQMNFAKAAIDAGADLILGHHPHVIQSVEKYNGKYIFYSLGNFVFDQTFSKETTRGLAVKIFLNKKGVTGYELHPVIIKDASQPELIEDSTEKADILQNIVKSL